MNRGRVLLIALFALALSLVVTWGSYNFLKDRLNPVRKTATIVVATKKLPLGTRLQAEHVELREWPIDMPLEGSFELTSEILNRGVILPIFPGEPILESRLAPMEAGAGLTAAIPEGMRAVSVKVNDVIGVAGFVVPGTFVDVILSGSPSQGNNIDTTKVVLENVQVLAAGQNVEPDENGRPESVQVITLLVTPEDAQRLVLASVDGRVQLALRNPLDLRHTDPEPVKRASLYVSRQREEPPPTTPAPVRRRPRPKAVAPPPPPPPAPRVLAVELIQGTSRETSTFEETVNE